MPPTAEDIKTCRALPKLQPERLPPTLRPSMLEIGCFVTPSPYSSGPPTRARDGGGRHPLQNRIQKTDGQLPSLCLLLTKNSAGPGGTGIEEHTEKIPAPRKQATNTLAEHGSRETVRDSGLRTRDSKRPGLLNVPAMPYGSTTVPLLGKNR